MLRDPGLPKGYRPYLDIRNVETAIKDIKDFFERNLARALSLQRVTAPLFVRSGTGVNDEAHTAAPDGAGGVYIGGFTTGSLGGPLAGLEDAWLAHYDSAGNQTWIRQLGTPSHDRANGAAPDGS